MQKEIDELVKQKSDAMDRADAVVDRLHRALNLLDRWEALFNNLKVGVKEIKNK